MKKIALLIGLLLVAVAGAASAQSFPSPQFNALGVGVAAPAPGDIQLTGTLSGGTANFNTYEQNGSNIAPGPTPQVHQNGGGDNNGPVLMWANQNNDLEIDHIAVFSLDQSIINNWTVGGTPRSGDLIGFTFTLAGTPYVVQYTVQSGDTSASIATALAACVDGGAMHCTGGPAYVTALAGFHGSDGYGYMPRAGASGVSNIVFDFPYAGSGNSVVAALSGGATETLTQNIGTFLDNGPYINVGRYVPGRAPVLNDELGAYLFGCQSGPSTNIDSTCGAMRLRVSQVGPLVEALEIGGAYQTGSNPMNFNVALSLGKGIAGALTDGSGTACSDPGFGAIHMCGTGLFDGTLTGDAQTAAGQAIFKYGSGQGLVIGQPSLGGNIQILDQANSVLQLGANNNIYLDIQPDGGVNYTSVPDEGAGTLNFPQLYQNSVTIKTVATSASASDLTAGTLASARGGAGSINGVLAGNGAGSVSQGTCGGLSDSSSFCNGTSAGNLTGTSPAVTLGNSLGVRAKLVGANLNTTSDQSISIGLPTGTTNYHIQGIFLSNPSTSMTSAICGVWTGASKTGATIVGSGATGVAMSGLTTNSPATSGSLIAPTVNNQNVEFYNSSTLFFACSTAQGATATADVTIDLQPLN